MALVQQTKEQTYKFTGSQRECSFMLMCSGFSIFLVIESRLSFLTPSRIRRDTFLEDVYKQKNPPFRVLKIGKLFRVPKKGFDEWLNGSL